MVKGLPSIQQPTSLCEIYILATHHRDKFVFGVSYRSKAPLELIHTYFYGSMQTPSLVGNAYFMTFIDDIS